MSNVTFNSFSGSIPRIASHLLKKGQASLALDCHLTSGQLASWREPKLVFDNNGDWDEATATAKQFDCCWHLHDSCVDIAFGSATCRNLYLTGRMGYPEELYFDPPAEDQSPCDPALWHYRRLGIPIPAGVYATPGAAPVGGEHESIEDRLYAIQYETPTGERGQLSNPARASVFDGQTVTLTMITPPSSEWGISKVNIYQTVAGDSYGRENAHTTDMTWMLVGSTTLPFGNVAIGFTSDILTRALEEDLVIAPPENLKGMVWIESMNALAGYDGNNLYFSENHTYNNWPHKMTLDDNIRGIVESNGLIYVATDGHPYVVKGEADCKEAGCRSVVRLPFAMPMVAHGNRHMAACSLGALYPSFKGLVLLAGDSQPVVLTWPLYSAEDWQAMAPETAITAQFDGKIYCFLANGAFAMAMPEGPEPGWGADSHTELSDRGVIDAYVNRQGQFLMVKNTGVYEWNRGDTLRPHTWRSNQHVEPTPYAFGAGHLYSENGVEHVTITVDGREILSRDVLSHRVFRIPMWSYGTRWAFELTGTATVSLLSVAAAMQDLGR